MSEVAGRLAPQVGSQYLERINHGRGILLGGVPGVPPAEVVVVGGGIVGSNAARIALSTGSKVTVIDKNLRRLRELGSKGVSRRWLRIPPFLPNRSCGLTC